MMRQPLRPRRWEKYLFTLILVPCLMLPIADTQENEVTDAQPQPPAKKLEEAVITDMLRIVDHKFDTLTTRITALERAVSSLQFFSIRQFRQIGGSLQTTQNDLEKISKQVGQLEVDQRGLKIAMSLLGRDVSEVKKNSDQLLEQLESNVAYIYENIDKQETFMKVLVEDTVLGSTREMTGLLAKQLDEVAADLKSQLGNTECADCTVNFTEISQHFDSAVAGYQHETQAHFDEIINSTMQEIMAVRLSDRGKMCVNDECQKDESIETEDDQDKTRSSLEESSIEQEHSEKSTTSSGAGSPTQSAQSDSARATEPLSESSAYRDENDERVMRALYNMTDSVLQAVSYFRNTGQMLENILSNTDMMISQQAAFTHKLNVLHLGQLVQGDAGSGPDHSNEIPIMDRENKEALLRSLQRDFKGCNLHVDLANSMATMIKNGSQLLEVLTDLAQMSSGSLTQATAALQDEITRVEGVRTRMATTLLAAGDESSPVAQLTNTTQRTFKLMEAVASNTGWLPLIYKNVQHVESLTNRSLHLTTRNEVMLRQVRQMAIANREEKKERPETPLSNRISHLPTSDETPSEFSALNRESLETIYSTSLQLNRIMPALTKLLAEPGEYRPMQEYVSQ